MKKRYQMILALMLAVFFLLPSATHAATVGSISGQLLNGSKKSAPIAGQSITLQMAQDNSAKDLTSVTTDAQGRFSFSGLNTDKGISYAIYTLYEGAQYVTDLIDLSKKPVQQLNLTAYEATTSTANIAIVQGSILIEKPDPQKGMLSISEDFFFENLGLTTYVGSLNSNGKKPNALLFSLPDNARQLSLSDGFNGYQSIQVNTGFATNAALLPGTTHLSFSFQVPYSSSHYDFKYIVQYATVALSLLVPLNILTTSSGLNAQGPVNANSQTYQLFKGKTLTASSEIHAQLEGLPVPKNAPPPPAPVSSNMLWLVVVLLFMLAIIALTWFLYRQRQRALRAQRRRIGSKAGAGVRDKQPGEARKKDVLLKELLELDTAYEAGTIKKAKYLERRAALKARLRTALSKEEVKELIEIAEAKGTQETHTAQAAKKATRSGSKGGK